MGMITENKYHRTVLVRYNISRDPSHAYAKISREVAWQTPKIAACRKISVNRRLWSGDRAAACSMYVAYTKIAPLGR